MRILSSSLFVAIALVCESAAAITITSPTKGQRIAIPSTFNVTWTTDGTNADTADLLLVSTGPVAYSSLYAIVQLSTGVEPALFAEDAVPGEFVFRLSAADSTAVLADSPSFFVGAAGATQSIATDTGTPTASATASATGTRTPASTTAAPAKSTSSNKALKIGLGVGIPLGLIAIAVVGGLLFYLLRQKKEINELRNNGQMHVGFAQHGYEDQEMNWLHGQGPPTGTHAGDVVTQPEAVAKSGLSPNPGAWHSKVPPKQG